MLSRDTSNLRSGRRVFRRTEIETAQLLIKQNRFKTKISAQVVRNSIGDRVVNVAFVFLLEVEQYHLYKNGFDTDFTNSLIMIFQLTQRTSGGSLGGNIVTDQQCSIRHLLCCNK